MRKGEAPAFAEFITDEAKKYGRSVTEGEIALWFETFSKTTLEDFKLAWVRHKRDERNGVYFPKIPWLQRHLRIEGDGVARGDWRCAEEIDGQRCGWPGTISEGVHGGGPWRCGPHARLKGTEDWSPRASLQIIELSQGYQPPKTLDELYALSDARRAAARKEREVQVKKAAPPVVARESDEEAIGQLVKHRLDAGLPPDLGVSTVPVDDAHLFPPEIEEAAP